MRARLYGHYYTPSQSVLRKRLIHNTSVVDDVQCFSDYAPRSMDNSSLTDRVISGISGISDNTGISDKSDKSGKHAPSKPRTLWACKHGVRRVQLKELWRSSEDLVTRVQQGLAREAQRWRYDRAHAAAH